MPVVSIAYLLQIVANHGQAPVHDLSVLGRNALADSLKDRIDLPNDVFTRRSALFRQNKRAFVALFLFGYANEIAVFLQKLDGTRNVRLVLFANIAKLL